MVKVRCSLCSNEKSGICLIKKIGVAVNKSRLCAAYTYDENKVKAKGEIPTTRLTYEDIQRQRTVEKLERRAQRNMLKKTVQSAAEKPNSIAAIPLRTQDPKYPTTGDLSRFLTTATQAESKE